MKIAVAYIPTHYEVTEWYHTTYHWTFKLVRSKSVWTWGAVED